jgi:DnaK suppressor protein
MAKKAHKARKVKKAKKVHKASKPRKAKKSSPKRSSFRMSIKAVKKSTGHKDVQEKPLTDAQISEFRDILTQKRDDLLTVVQRKKEQEIQAGEIEVGDEADIATRSVEKEMLFELTDSEKQTLDMIEASLRKMEKGVYGRCESCQKAISKLRIEVMPWARYCINCQAEQEIPSGGE